MALTRPDCMAAASALIFLGLLGGESALVLEATHEPHVVRLDENPFIDSGAHEAYLAVAYAALQPRVAAEQEAAPPQTDTDLENR